MSTKNQYTSISAIENALEVAHQNAISYKGKKGYFVDMDSLLSMEKCLENMNEEPSDDDKISKMKADIAALKLDNKSIGAECKQLRDYLNQAKEDARGFQLQFEAAIAERNAAQMEKKAERQRISKEIDDLKAAKQAVEMKIKSSEAKFDPAISLDLQEQSSELRKQLKMLNEHLEVNNMEITSLNNEVSSIKHKLDTAKSQRDSYKEQLDSLTKMRNKSANLLQEQIVLPKPKYSKLTERVLGQKGMTWLHKAEECMWNDYRERVYCLMLATKSGTSEHARTLSNLLEIVFNWLKQQSKRLHKKIASWVELVENDIREMKIKSIKFYRQKLEELKIEIDLKRKNKEKYGTWERENEKWYETIMFYGQVIQRRIRRKTNSFLSGIGNFFNGVFSKILFWTRHRTFQKGKEKEANEEIFDYEKEALRIKNEAIHEHDGGAPFIPVKRKGKAPTSDAVEKGKKVMEKLFQPKKINEPVIAGSSGSTDLAVKSMKIGPAPPPPPPPPAKGVSG